MPVYHKQQPGRKDTGRNNMMMLTRTQARQEVRSHWREIILNYTTKAQKRVSGKDTYICPLCRHGQGGDGIKDNPKSNDGNGIICFSCGFSGDIIDLIMKDTGADYNTALKKAADHLGIQIEPYRPTAADDFRNVAGGRAGATQTGTKDQGGEKPTGQPKAAQEPPQAADYTEYYNLCMYMFNDSAGLSYLQARGISEKTAQAYNLGFDPAADPANVPGAMDKNIYRPHPAPRVIIPVSKSYYVARRIDGISDYKVSYPKGSRQAIFNTQALYKDHGAVFITEGAIDALSIIEADGQAIATNSANNTQILLDMLREKPTKSAIIICPDNDGPGQRAADKLDKGLEALNIRHMVYSFTGGKDANDALTADRAAFIQAVKAAEDQAKGLPPMEPAQDQQEPGDGLPGLLTFTGAVELFRTADKQAIELKSFPMFSKAAKIRKHDSVVIAADTGGGKSSLAINFMYGLSDSYPCIYFNLEMDTIDVLQRLVAIHTGMEIDRVEGYQQDAKTAEAVNIALQAITARKPVQIIQGEYTLERIQEITEKAIAGREETTIVFIDHSLLMDTQKYTAGRYDRFTQISEGLRKMALKNNIILFVLLQQNREGKKDDSERPRNSSLKESGSWENDSTQIVFLWYDPADRKKKLLLTKNRHGEGGEFILNYWKKTQTYTEAKDQEAARAAVNTGQPPRQSKREKQKAKLLRAYDDAMIATQGHPTLKAIAEAADVTTSTVKGWIKEYGGCMIDGVQQEPAGIDTTVEYTGFVKLTPADDPPEQFSEPAAEKRAVTARF